MIYEGIFTDMCGMKHTVRIYTGWSPTYNADNDTTTAITLGETPFVTTMDSGDDTIYKPLKCTGGTIQVVTEGYLFDVYSATAQGTKVVVRNALNVIEWTGYATPNLYDMGYQALETIEIECIDGLSTLQYIKYTPVGGTRAVHSFAEIVRHILRQCNCYTRIYFTSNVTLPNISGALLTNLYISESNFFDKKSDENKSDTDAAWTCQEVLEQLAQFIGCSVFSYADAIYFVDYDSLKAVNGRISWHVYDVNTDAAPTTSTSNTPPFALESGKYYDNSATLSLGDVFSKITVKCTLNDFDDVMPDIFDGAVNITKDDPNMECPKTTNTHLGDDSSPMYGATIESAAGNSSSDMNTKMLAFVDINGKSDNSKTFENSTWMSGVFVKYFDNPAITCHKYLYNGSGWDDVTGNYDKLCYTDTLALSGAFMVKSEVLWMREIFSVGWYTAYAKARGSIIQFINEFTDTDHEEVASRLDLDEYILLLNPIAHQPNYSGASTEHMWDAPIPFVETSLSDVAALYGGDNAYYVISGGVIWDGATKNSNYPLDCSNEKVDINTGRKDISQPMAYLRCKLEQGGRWWDGERWTTTESIFKLYFVKENTEELRADTKMFTELRIVNTVTWDMGLDVTGYAIPVDGVLSGTPKLTILNPMDFGGASGYQCRMLALKNFQLKAVIGDPSYSGALDTDTEYTNVIDAAYVSEAQELEFKVNTWDGKRPNFSCVACKIGNAYHFVDKLINEALADDVQNVTTYHGATGELSDGTLRSEEWMVLRMVKQYSSPAKIFECSYKSPAFNINPAALFTSATLGCTFIVDKMVYDYKRRKVDLKLVEKK